MLDQSGPFILVIN